MNLLKPELLINRNVFILSFVGVIAMIFGIFYLQEVEYFFDSNETFAASFLIPIYFLYFVMYARFNDIGKLHILVYVFSGILLLSWVLVTFDIQLGSGGLVDAEEAEFYTLCVMLINLVFGWLLILYGFVKPGLGIRESLTVVLHDRIGRLDPKHLKEVKKSHKPDFAQSGLVLLFRGKQRPIMNNIDYETLQPGTLSGARLFEFSLDAVE